MVVTNRGHSHTPAAITTCPSTQRFDYEGHATATDRSRNVAIRQASAAADAEKALARANVDAIRCPAGACTSGSICTFTGITNPGTSNKRGSTVKNPVTKIWTAVRHRNSYLSKKCRCRRFTTIAYHKSLKKEFLLARNALIKLEIANQKLLSKTSTRTKLTKRTKPKSVRKRR